MPSVESREFEAMPTHVVQFHFNQEKAEVGLASCRLQRGELARGVSAPVWCPFGTLIKKRIKKALNDDTRKIEKEDRYLRDTIIVSAHARNLGLQ